MIRRKIFAVVAATALVVALCVPLVASATTLTLSMNMLVWALFTLSFSLLVGQAGLLSFGHAAFFGIGAFASLHVMKLAEAGGLVFPTPLLPLTGGAAALLLGLGVGYFATLRTGIYFAMITFAAAELIASLAPSMPGVFGGESGFTSMRAPSWGLTFANDTQVYYLVLAWTIGCAIVMHAYTRTLFGRLTVGLRENDQRIAFLGYDPHKTKIVVFALSAFFAGISGGLLTLVTESASSALFAMHTNAVVLLYTYIGGATTFLGPAVGAAVLVMLASVVSEHTRLWFLYQGIIFAAVVMLVPKGLYTSLLHEVERLREGGVPALARSLRTILGIGLVAVGVVFVCEFAAVVLAGLQSAAGGVRAATQSIRLFGIDWVPGSILTWLVPAACIAGGLLILRGWQFARHRSAASARAAAAAESVAAGPAVR